MVIDAVTDAVVFLLLIIAQTEAAVRGATDCPVTPGCGRKTGDERVKKKKKKKKRIGAMDFFTAVTEVCNFCAASGYIMSRVRVFSSLTLY